MPVMRMSRAISFGVFCRLAPSTSAIIRSRKVSPGWEVIWTTIRSREHDGAAGHRGPVAARLAEHRGGLAGDRRLVDDGDALDDVAVAGDDLVRGDDAAVAERELGGRDGLGRAVGVEAVGDRVPAGLAERVRLGLAAAFGDRLGEVGEQHGRPQPEGDQSDEDAGPGDELDGGDDGADLDHEHDRDADHRPRVELDERLPHRGAQDRRARAGRRRAVPGPWAAGSRPGAPAAPGWSPRAPWDAGRAGIRRLVGELGQSGSESRSIIRSSTRTRPIASKKNATMMAARAASLMQPPPQNHSGLNIATPR